MGRTTVFSPLGGGIGRAIVFSGVFSDFSASVRKNVIEKFRNLFLF